jgi:ABC-type nitrate/sulfonate/bicarbonate transport system substrate-binding protein
VAQEKGFFSKQGLLVEPIFFGAGPPAMQALVAGDLDIAASFLAQLPRKKLRAIGDVIVAQHPLAGVRIEPVELAVRVE